MTAIAEVQGLEARKTELKAAWDRLESENNDIVGTAPVVEGILQISNERREAFEKNFGQMKQIQADMDMIGRTIEAKTWAGAPVGGPSGLAEQARWTAEQMLAAAAGDSTEAASRYKSLGQLFTESKEFDALVKSGRATMDAPYLFRGRDLGSRWEAKAKREMEAKDVYSAAPSGGPPLGFKPLYREDIVVQAFRKVRVRDLFPVQSTTAAVIEYFRVIGFVSSNAAAPTPERLTDNSNFGIAPHTNLNFQGVQSPTRLINHWEAAHRNVLNDVPQLQGIIDTELLYGLRLAEDNQLLNGTGNGEDILGLLNQPNIQSYAALNAGTSGARSGSGSGLATDTKADDIRRAATQAILAYYEPTGVIMHPTDWEHIETLKDSQGAYIIAIAVALGAEQRIWRLPVVDTPAIAVGTSLVGSFGLGAKLYDREEGTVRIAEQHMDFFLRSAIVVLAEERLALTCPRPESFVKVTFGA